MTMQHVPKSYDGGIQWAVKRNDYKEPFYHYFPSETEARSFYDSQLALAVGNLPNHPDYYPELVAARITWQVQAGPR